MSLFIRSLSVFTVFVAVAIASTVALAEDQLGFADNVFTRVDELHELGEIDAEQRIFYRVAALRNPSLLPEELRSLEKRTGNPMESKSEIMFEAYKSLKDMSSPVADQLEPLLQPLPPLAHHLEMTTPFPLRVYYDNTADQTKAQAILDAAALSYQREVEDWGFWAPPVDPANGHYEVFIDYSIGGGGYTAPYEEVPSTTHSDAYSYIVMGGSNPASQMPVIFAHEFNHACQASFDMWERWAFYEATATYIMSQVYPSDWYYTEYFMPSFQGLPHKALDWQDYGGDGMGYVYGASLWVIFLESLFGQDDPSWIATVWEDCVQPDGSPNEPDYFDAVDGALAQDGGFEENFLLFSQYRYFVGVKDDGNHLPGAGSWMGSEVAIEDTWSRSDLPVTDEGPSTNTQPEQNGCNYIQLNMGAGGDGLLKIDFNGEAGISWNVDVMVKEEGEDTIFETISLNGTNGEHEISVQEDNRVVLVICHLADSSYDPDNEAWVGADYTYSIDFEEQEGVASVDAVTPSNIAQGAQDVELTIEGEGFEDWDGLSVQVSGDGISVTDVTFVSETSVTCTISASFDATVGDRDVVVVLEGNDEITGSGLLEVVEGENGEESKGGGGSDCGCSTAGAGQGGLLELISAIL